MPTSILDLFRLDGRVALVTGAASGLGASIAKALAEAGAQLAVHGNRRAATDTAAEIGPSAAAFQADLGDTGGAEKLFAEVRQRFGRIDILVNNAGGGIIRPFVEHTPETLKATIARNLWTAIWCSWRAAPLMRKARFGRIVNIGADSVRNGLWDHAAYNAAKGGVHGLTTGMAREFARDGVTVNTVAPCATNTPQMQAVIARDPALADRFVSVIPMGRPAEMSEVASMVSYLASEEAAFVTGQIISVNGGSTML
jgi:2,3-dihydroxy-2,3-dihydro-p-cumate dehydrogenase